MRAGQGNFGELGSGQFGLLVDHRTGRYLGAVVIRRGDKVLEFNPGDAEAVFQPGDFPLGTGGNLEEARANAAKVLDRERSRLPLGVGGRKRLWISKLNAGELPPYSLVHDDVGAVRAAIEEIQSTGRLPWVAQVLTICLKKLQEDENETGSQEITYAEIQDIDGVSTYAPGGIASVVNKFIAQYGLKLFKISATRKGSSMNPNTRYQLALVRRENLASEPAPTPGE